MDGPDVDDPDVDALHLAGGGEVDFRQDTVRFTPDQAVLSEEIRHVDGAYFVRYVQAPGDPFPDQKPWLRLPLKDIVGPTAPGQGANLAGAFVIGAAEADPRQLLVAVRELARDARKVASETVSGQIADRYRVRLRVPRKPGRFARSSLLTLENSSVIDVWVRDGKIRRAVLAGPERATIDLADFGAEVDIPAPPPNSTIRARKIDEYEAAAEKPTPSVGSSPH